MTGLTLTIDLAIDVPGASQAEIERGIAAAWRVFADAGVTAWEAASAAFHQESIDDGGGDWGECTEREVIAAEAWRVADRRAAVACCAGWADVPDTARLQLVYDRDAYNAWARKQWARQAPDPPLLRPVGTRDR
jgi:hypothetical protein